MKVALVHDYIKELGGAERVLKTLTEMYPNAPIYTAFSVKGSTAEIEFGDKDLRESWLASILKIGKLYSPLRFLIPWIWSSFDLSEYDLVITSCSWYITRGFKIGPKTKVVAYCHTPPRWLYGYGTSVGFTKYWPVKVYSAIVGHFIRLFDFKTAQLPGRNPKYEILNTKQISNSKSQITNKPNIQNTKYDIQAGVDCFIANSEEVAERIKKFYRRDSVVIYPPIDVEEIRKASKVSKGNEKRKNKKTDKYFLIASRLVGAKGIEEAINVFSNQKKYKLKIVGESAGFYNSQSLITSHQSSKVDLLGRVSDEELYRLYVGAAGFIALARQEDFGMTVVEAMAAGCPAIAFNGGGFRETVVDGVTGILIDDTDIESINKAIKRFEEIKWSREKIQKHAEKFSKERFKKDMINFVAKVS